MGSLGDAEGGWNIGLRVPVNTYTGCLCLALLLIGSLVAEDPATIDIEEQVVLALAEEGVQPTMALAGATAKLLSDAATNQEFGAATKQAIRMLGSLRFNEPGTERSFDAEQIVIVAALTKEGDDENREGRWSNQAQLAGFALQPDHAYLSALGDDQRFRAAKDMVEWAVAVAKEMNQAYLPDYNPDRPWEVLTREEQVEWGTENWNKGTHPKERRIKNEQLTIRRMLPGLKNDLKAFIVAIYPNSRSATRHARSMLEDLEYSEEQVDLVVGLLEQKD